MDEDGISKRVAILSEALGILIIFFSIFSTSYLALSQRDFWPKFFHDVIQSNFSLTLFIFSLSWIIALILFTFISKKTLNKWLWIVSLISFIALGIYYGYECRKNFYDYGLVGFDLERQSTSNIDALLFNALSKRIKQDSSLYNQFKDHLQREGYNEKDSRDTFEDVYAYKYKSRVVYNGLYDSIHKQIYFHINWFGDSTYLDCYNKTTKHRDLLYQDLNECQFNVNDDVELLSDFIIAFIKLHNCDSKNEAKGLLQKVKQTVLSSSSIKDSAELLKVINNLIVIAQTGSSPYVQIIDSANTQNIPYDTLNSWIDQLSITDAGFSFSNFPEFIKNPICISRDTLEGFIVIYERDGMYFMKASSNKTVRHYKEINSSNLSDPVTLNEVSLTDKELYTLINNNYYHFYIFPKQLSIEYKNGSFFIK